VRCQAFAQPSLKISHHLLRLERWKRGLELREDLVVKTSLPRSHDDVEHGHSLAHVISQNVEHLRIKISFNIPFKIISEIKEKPSQPHE